MAHGSPAPQAVCLLSLSFSQPLACCNSGANAPSSHYVNLDSGRGKVLQSLSATAHGEPPGFFPLLSLVWLSKPCKTASGLPAPACELPLQLCAVRPAWILSVLSQGSCTLPLSRYLYLCTKKLRSLSHFSLSMQRSLSQATVRLLLKHAGTSPARRPHWS